MTSPFKVVAVSGGTYRPSRTLVLTQALIAELGQSLPIDSRVIELTDIAAPLGATLARNHAPPVAWAGFSPIRRAILSHDQDPGTVPGAARRAGLGRTARHGAPTGQVARYRGWRSAPDRHAGTTFLRP